MKAGHRSAHRALAVALAGAVVAILVLAYGVMQDPSDAPPPQRLSD